MGVDVKVDVDVLVEDGWAVGVDVGSGAQPTGASKPQMIRMASRER
jgi:hypothetical protein